MLVGFYFYFEPKYLKKNNNNHTTMDGIVFHCHHLRGYITADNWRKVLHLYELWGGED